MSVGREYMSEEVMYPGDRPEDELDSIAREADSAQAVDDVEHTRSRQIGERALRIVKEKPEPEPAAEDNVGLEIITFSVSAQQRADNQQTAKPRGLRRGL